MKLLQNRAGNFLNMTPSEAKTLAEKLLQFSDEAAKGGFVQTIILQEDRSNPSHESVLDTIFVGISPTWLDVHPSLEADLRLREPGTMHIDRSAVNVRDK